MRNWSQVEQILTSSNIKPIIAVIPDNRDEALKYQEPDKNFWLHIKELQDKGWTIAQHGTHHKRHRLPLHQSFLELNSDTEFKGLPQQDQARLIRKGYEILTSKGIQPIAWVSPCHTADKNTIKALETCTNIQYFSDGIGLNAFKSKNLTFIPQQLWQLQYKRSGLWTVCVHPSNMTDTEIQIFSEQIKKFRKQIISVQNIDLNRSQRFLEVLYKIKFWTFFNLKKYLKKIL